MTFIFFKTLRVKHDFHIMVCLILTMIFVTTQQMLIWEIRTLSSILDMTLARIESITGLKFEPNRNGTVMYIYDMRFDDGNKVSFVLSVEHMNEKYGMIRPNYVEDIF